MKHTAIVALVAVNAFLLAGLVNRATVNAPGGGPSLAGVAYAQNQNPAQNRTPRPGDYLMIPGEVTGGSSSVVYVIDTTNGWLGAFAYDDAVKRVEAMPNRIDLAQIFSQAGGANIDVKAPNDPNNRRRN